MHASDYMADAAREYGRKMADQVADYVSAKVQHALVLERDRHDEAIAELRDELHVLARKHAALRAIVTGDDELHSVKVEP